MIKTINKSFVISLSFCLAVLAIAVLAIAKPPASAKANEQSVSSLSSNNPYNFTSDPTKGILIWDEYPEAVTYTISVLHVGEYDSWFSELATVNTSYYFTPNIFDGTIHTLSLRANVGQEGIALFAGDIFIPKPTAVSSNNPAGLTVHPENCSVSWNPYPNAAKYSFKIIYYSEYGNYYSEVNTSDSFCRADYNLFYSNNRLVELYATVNDEQILYFSGFVFFPEINSLSENIAGFGFNYITKSFFWKAQTGARKYFVKIFNLFDELISVYDTTNTECTLNDLTIRDFYYFLDGKNYLVKLYADTGSQEVLLHSEVMKFTFIDYRINGNTVYFISDRSEYYFAYIYPNFYKGEKPDYSDAFSVDWISTGNCTIDSVYLENENCLIVLGAAIAGDGFSDYAIKVKDLLDAEVKAEVSNTALGFRVSNNILTWNNFYNSGAFYLEIYDSESELKYAFNRNENSLDLSGLYKLNGNCVVRLEFNNNNYYTVFTLSFTRLDTPTLSVEGNYIVWNEIAGATHYRVFYGGTFTDITANRINFLTLEFGIYPYTVKVRAIHKGVN